MLDEMESRTINADRCSTSEASPDMTSNRTRTPRGRASTASSTKMDAAEAARFREIAEQSQIGMALLDRDRILYMNVAGLARFGAISLDEITSRPVWDFIDPDDADGARERLASAAAGRLYGRTILKCLHLDGTPRVLEAEGWPMRYLGQDVVRITFEDVTKRHESEHALRESEERFRLTFECAPGGVALLDLDGTVLRANSALNRMLGYPEEEFLGRRFQDITHPDDLEVNQRYLDELLDGSRDSYQIEKRYIRHDGSFMWANVTCSIVRDADGCPRHLVGHVEDIHHAQEAEKAHKESEERFRSVWEMSVEGLRLVDKEGLIVDVNGAYCRMVHKTAEELIGQPYTVVYRDPVISLDEFSRRMRGRAIKQFFDINMVLWSGQDLWLAVINTFIEREGHDPLLLSSFRDVTEQKRTETALHRYRLLAKHSNDIMFFVRQDGAILAANQAAEKAYGYSARELRSMSYNELVDTSARPEDHAALPSSIPSRVGAVFPACHRRKGGRPFPVEMSVQTIDTDDESLMLMVIRDTTERTALERQLRHQASHDALTKLPNRLLFMDRLEQALLRRDGRVTVLFLDLDRFKNINDSLGHSAGDQLLTAVAGRLKSCIRAADTAARLGGDEFTVLLDGCDGAGEATRTAKRILRKLEAPFEVMGQEVFISASIGVAVGQNKSTTAEHILGEADLAMYQAKSSGKARHAVFVHGHEEDMKGRLQLETDLRRAIERGEFQVYYQPVVLMETKRTIAIEALTRWHHPRFGLMPPDEFVPIQEQIGMIEPFTMWVLNEAQQQCLELQRQGMRVSVAVNLSPYNLHEPDFAARVRRMLDESGLIPSSLKLEITESAIMTNPERALQILSELNEMGVRLSVDDFGTGYSSLTYLKQLPVHEIKIDKSFVIGMDANDEDDAAIVRATIDLAHNLRKKVVAEGVESAEVWNLLNVLGCDAAQGFHMSPPLPALDLIPWLKASPFGLGRIK